jgi:copper chaperone CopZ
VQQHLGRLEGVARVDVSLAEGRVAIVAKEDSRLDPAQVFKATYDSGVSVVEMTMEATGSLERDSKGGLIFRTAGTQVYPVVESEVLKPFGEIRSSERVVVRARLFKKVGKQQPKTLGAARLELIEVRKQP